MCNTVQRVPKDPIMLLSFVNTQLRDNYPNADELAAALDISRGELDQRLAAVNYYYDKNLNQYR